MRPSFLHLELVPERCFEHRGARVACSTPGGACGWIATSCLRADVLQSATARRNSESSPQEVNGDLPRAIRLHHEEAVAQRPRRLLTAAVVDHVSAQPRADGTQVGCPCSLGV